MLNYDAIFNNAADIANIFDDSAMMDEMLIYYKAIVGAIESTNIDEQNSICVVQAIINIMLIRLTHTGPCASVSSLGKPAR